MHPGSAVLQGERVSQGRGPVMASWDNEQMWKKRERETQRQVSALTDEVPPDTRPNHFYQSARGFQVEIQNEGGFVSTQFLAALSLASRQHRAGGPRSLHFKPDWAPVPRQFLNLAYTFTEAVLST